MVASTARAAWHGPVPLSSLKAMATVHHTVYRERQPGESAGHRQMGIEANYHWFPDDSEAFEAVRVAYGPESPEAELVNEMELVLVSGTNRERVPPLLLMGHFFFCTTARSRATRWAGPLTST